MFCREHKWLWVGINRTATSSMNVALESNFSVEGHKHDTLEETRSIIGESSKDYWVFTFVRNPWERLASVYLHRKQFNYGDVKDLGYPFGAWVRKCLYIDGDGPELDIRFIMPQVCWLEDIYGRIQVDFIGRFERLKQDWVKVCQKLGMQNTALQWISANLKRPDYWAMYDNELIDLVGEYYQADIERFGYQF